jgi:hypothetical protein
MSKKRRKEIAAARNDLSQSISSDHQWEETELDASDDELRLQSQFVGSRQRIKSKELPSILREVFNSALDEVIKSILTDDAFPQSIQLTKLVSFYVKEYWNDDEALSRKPIDKYPHLVVPLVEGVRLSLSLCLLLL